MKIKFTAKIAPVPLGRSRFNTKTKKIYYPKRSKIFKNELGMIGRAAMRGKAPLKGALLVTLDLYKNCKILSKHYGDVDNHQKSIFDALNEICYDDDSQIVKVICEKHKDTIPKIEIQIEEIEISD